MKSQSRFRVHATGPARRDIAAVARWSKQEFGARASARYETLIRQALQDIKSDPDRLGVRARTDLGDPVHTYHLQFSRHNFPQDVHVRRPRHYFVYRVKDDLVEILRLIHDAQDLERHLPSEEL